MKQFVWILLFFWAALSHGATAEYSADCSALPPVLDGEIENDPAWKAVPWSSGFEKRGTAGTPVANTRFKALYTVDALYLAAECMEPQMDKIASEHNYIEFWLCDVVEVFLIPMKNEMIHLIYSARNNANEEIPGKTAIRTKYQTGWTAKSKMGKDRWCVEFCIPLFLLGVAPSAGEVSIPFNLCRNSTPEKELSSWSFQKGSFKSPLGFGILSLKKSPPSLAGKLNENLLRPHWLSLLKRWQTIRKDPSWQEILAANPEPVKILSQIEKTPSEYSAKAALFAENLALLERQSEQKEKLHKLQVKKLLFEEE